MPSDLLYHAVHEGLFLFFWSCFSSAFMFVVPYLAVMSVIVFVHEMGHFVAGRLVGAPIQTFSLGLGREVVGFTSASGIRWSLSMIPVGGYVKFLADADATGRVDRKALDAVTPEQRRSLLALKSPAQRSFVYFAGPLANIVFTFLITTIVLCAYGRLDVRAVVGAVVPDSPAVHAGLQAGDVITSINGHPMLYFRDLRDQTIESAGRPLAMSLARKGVGTIQVDVTPAAVSQPGPFGVELNYIVGVQSSTLPEDLVMRRFGVVSAMAESGREVRRISVITFTTIGNIFAGRTPVTALSGPVKIAKVTQVTARDSGILGLVQLTGFLSLSVGLFNLLPIPVLDGGHLVFTFYEVLRGKPLNPKVFDVMLRVGLAFIFFFIFVVTCSDIASLFAVQ